MRLRIIAWALLVGSPAWGLGTFELEAPLEEPGGARGFAALTLVFPDSMAGADVRALLVPANAVGTLLLPGGRMGPAETDFLEGLRGFASGNPAKASEAWARLRTRRLAPLLRACLNVDAGVLLCLRGETAAAESVWTAEWRSRSPAREGAWRNLVGLFVAKKRWRAAERLLDAVLVEQPRNRAAAMAKAALMRQLRPDAEWEAFLLSKSSPEDSMPDLQLAYGEYLVGRGRYAEAGRLLDRGLAALPRYGRGWVALAQVQFRLGYDFFAADCLENALRSGYRESDLYELYAQVLRDCCMQGDEERALRARRAAEHLLEEGLPKDLHRRSMAQLLYHVYCQNGKGAAGRELEQSLWFHFKGPALSAPALAFSAWPQAGLPSRRLKIHYGLYAFGWVMSLRHRDVFRAF